MDRLLPRRQLVLPLGVQLLGLLIGALIVAQTVTLVLTMLLPPAPSQRWNLETVSDSLLGRGKSASLDRRMMSGPPDISGSGWLVSETSRQALAERVDRPVDQVVLAFYTQLPVGGLTVPAPGSRKPMEAQVDNEADVAGTLLQTLVTSAHAQAGPGAGPPGGLPGGGFPGGGFPGGGFPGGGPPGGGPPGGGAPGGRTPGGGAPGGGGPGGTVPGGIARGGTAPIGTAPLASQVSSQASSPVASGRASGIVDAPFVGGVSPAGPGNSPATGPLASPGGPNALPGAFRAPDLALPRPDIARPPMPGSTPSGANVQPPSQQAVIATANGVAIGPTRQEGVAPDTQRSVPAQPAADAARGAMSMPEPIGTPQPIPFRAPSGLLSFTTPPFIEGDFIAAMRRPDGRWVAVAPRAEPFPNRWQKRVMLWFMLSLLIVAPLVLLFARRIVKPLESFARAAETLGRDPAASILSLSGPAEIGRAAHAFNQMRDRLRAFVGDRTAMVGAISHDLRTPLTRLRFRLEDVPDDQRDALLAEVDEMECMITQVITFIRDASTPGVRERLDLGALVEGAVQHARVMGSEITLDITGRVPVEVDPLGIKRLVSNLIENATKYGQRTRVRVQLRDDAAIAEVIDCGPGIPEDERERAFEPFTRLAPAIASNLPGSGLGLAVCRSIARAHGGDVVLEQRAEGFVARLILPVRYDDPLSWAA